MRKGADPGSRNYENELPSQLVPEGATGEKVRCEMILHVVQEVMNEHSYDLFYLVSGATDPERKKCSRLSKKLKNTVSQTVCSMKFAEIRQMFVVSVKHVTLFITR